MANSADPDQLASSEANWSGSTLFAKTGHVVFSKRRVKCYASRDPTKHRKWSSAPKSGYRTYPGLFH